MYVCIPCPNTRKGNRIVKTEKIESNPDNEESQTLITKTIIMTGNVTFCKTEGIKNMVAYFSIF